MSDIRSSEVAFAGVRFIRGNPGAVAIWAGVYLLAAFVLVGALIFMAGPDIGRLQSLDTGSAAVSDVGLDLLFRAGPAFVLVGLAACAAFSMVYAGAARAVLRPEQKAGAYLRLGADELRQFLLFLLMAVVFLAAYLAVAMAATAVVVGGILLLRDTGAGGVAIGILVGVVGAIAVVCGAIYCAVRLSLASPLTFDRGRVDLFGSWALTKGRFWSLLGAYLLAWLVAMIVNAASAVINLTVLGVGGGLSGLMQGNAPDMSSLAAYFTPAVVAGLVVSAAAAAMMWPIMLMPASEVYRQITGDNPADAF